MIKRILIGAALLTFGLAGCTMYVRPTPPPVKVEVKPAKPHRHVVWVPGHWRWRNRRVGYVWVPGHWKRVR